MWDKPLSSDRESSYPHTTLVAAVVACRVESYTRKSTITSMAWRTEGTRRCGPWNDRAKRKAGRSSAPQREVSSISLPARFAPVGSSGTWLARALPDDGELVTVEHDPETASIARKNLEKTGVATKVKILVGDAQAILKDLKGPFDYIFNDIDKAGYPAVLEPAIERLRVGGLLVTDNVLWGGDVARKDRSSETQAIRTYNERLAKDPRMIASIVPLRDGVSVALKVRD